MSRSIGLMPSFANRTALVDVAQLEKKEEVVEISFNGQSKLPANLEGSFTMFSSPVVEAKNKERTMSSLVEVY